MRYPRRAACGVAVVLALTACGDGGTDPGGELTLVLTPAALDTFFALGHTAQLQAVLRDGRGPVQGVTVTFATSDGAVADVSGTGLVTAAGNGTARITATARTASAFVDVRVRQRLAGVAVQPGTLTLVVGRSATLTAAGVDAGGSAITTLPPAVFATADAGVLRVEPNGAVTAESAGTATVTATVTSAADGSRSADVAVSVLSAPPSSASVVMTAASFVPDVVEIVAGGTVTWENTSGVMHDVDFGSPALRIAPFDAGERSLSFPTAGSFAYHCNLHSGMTGTVVVR